MPRRGTGQQLGGGTESGPQPGFPRAISAQTYLLFFPMTLPDAKICLNLEGEVAAQKKEPKLQ